MRGVLKISVIKFLAITIFFVILISSMSYSLFYYSGIEARGDGIKIFRFGLLFLIFYLCILFYVGRKKLIKKYPFLIFLGLILFSFFVSILNNSPRDYIASFFRYLSYLALANIVYTLVVQKGESWILIVFKRFNCIFLIISILFGYYEIFSGQVQYLNEDYRVAGPFRFHQLAFGMFLFVNLISFYELSIKGEKDQYKKIWKVILYLACFYLFIRTGSRALLITYFLAYFILFFLKERSFYRRFRIVILSIVLTILALGALLGTNISPRLTKIFISENPFNDGSTMSRIAIHVNSFEGFLHQNQFIGIGLGGFTSFYRDLTGADGIAAHNNYLLFLVEGGYLGLFLFLAFQISMFLFLRKNLNQGNNSVIKVGFLLFIGIDILSSMQNNYYFFTTELLVWAVYGWCFGLNDIRNKE